MKTMGFRPVALPIADILPGLETGLIDTVPVAPLWSLVGQFDRVTRYMLPIKWVPIVGATVFTYLLNNWALGHVESSLVVLYIYLQPIVATTCHKLRGIIWIVTKLHDECMVVA